ncbi:hypothetical protein GCM10020331_019910 [Ectobacillus funiculus]
MKNTFSRLFGFGERDTEITLHEEAREEIKQIPIADIIPNRYQPRTVFLMIEELRNLLLLFEHMVSSNLLSFVRMVWDNMRLLPGKEDFGPLQS